MYMRARIYEILAVLFVGNPFQCKPTLNTFLCKVVDTVPAIPTIDICTNSGAHGVPDNATYPATRCREC